MAARRCSLRPGIVIPRRRDVAMAKHVLNDRVRAGRRLQNEIRRKMAEQVGIHGKPGMSTNTLGQRRAQTVSRLTPQPGRKQVVVAQSREPRPKAVDVDAQHCNRLWAEDVFAWLGVLGLVLAENQVPQAFPSTPRREHMNAETKSGEVVQPDRRGSKIAAAAADCASSAMYRDLNKV